jgi:hypothetical protein
MEFARTLDITTLRTLIALQQNEEKNSSPSLQIPRLPKSD